MRKKQIIMPRISRPASGEPRRWYIYFSVFDEITGKLQRFRKTEGFAACQTDDECLANARRLRQKYTEKLKRGWTPFEDHAVVWDDSLEYRRIASKKLPSYRSKKTVAYYSVLYMKTKEDRAKKTYQTYMSKFRVFRQWLNDNKLSDFDVSLITSEHAKLFLAALVKNDKAGKTKNEYVRLLQNFWDFIRKDRKGMENIWKDFEHFRNDTRPHVPFKRGVLQMLKIEMERSNPQLWLAAQFLYYCFIRPGELRQMQLKHVDLYEGRITLYSNMTKSRKTRVVEISENFLSQLIKDYRLQDYPEDFYVFSKTGEPGPVPVSRDYFNKQFVRIRKKLKLPSFYKFYAFKHTGAVIALRAGADIKEIQHQMGHSSLAITDEYMKSMVGYESEFFRKKMPEI